MKKLIPLVLLLSLVACAPAGRLSLWKPGELDIHCINTGRGESSFLILPDGTTILVDAAGSNLKKHKYMPTPPKPDSTVSSGKAIINYIRHFAPKTDTLDYFVLTHYHVDHMGDPAKDAPIHPEGGFGMSSICEVGSALPFRNLLTRGNPAEVKSSNCTNDRNMANFAKFVDWTVKANGTRYAYFDPSSDSQIVPLHKSVKNFKVSNLAANGYYRTPEGTAATDIPSRAQLDAQGDPKAYPGENALSCTFILSYGPFDYFAGGDLQWAHKELHDYFDIELPVSRVCRKVEVMKASHHCTKGANGPDILGALKPDVVLAHVWRDVQPNPETLQNIYDASPGCKVFLTNLAPKNEPVIADYLDRIASKQGHIVIRVSKGGTRYTIYTLDDNDPAYHITGKWGPFACN